MEHKAAQSVDEFLAGGATEPANAPYFPLGFPVSGDAWRRLVLSEVMKAPAWLDGKEQTSAIRQLAYRLHLSRGGQAGDLPEVKPGHLQAFGLLQDIMRHIFNLYCHDQCPMAMEDMRAALRGEGLSRRLERSVAAFVNHFPPVSVATGKDTIAGFLAAAPEPGAMTNPHRTVRELCLLSLCIENPALQPYRTLFDDTELEIETGYKECLTRIEEHFTTTPAVDPLDDSLFTVLRAPMNASPDSLEGQLEYIRVHWARLTPSWLMRRLLLARDALREETRMRGFGKGSVPVLRFGPGAGDGFGGMGYPEPERFTRDKEWMSTVVLIAKVTYVWLDQLTRQYGRPITRLDEVPDKELDRLAGYGFTGLWLIGVWERSIASEMIKKRMGNPEAAASAYSLYDYEIASALGGESAYLDLKNRAWAKGIRLATDMVPNHMGIHSRWMTEHPDWFIQDRQSPFPSYTFNGPDLSPDSRVAIHVEDHYWDKSDAAVVFKRVDAWTGDTRYIYHGNDGTNMAWNDTAQLNYLMPEVREAVIQTILHVARLSPIIRFDAAMTLAKKHFQRLWFPQPGEGGAIPSRSLFSMTREAFEAALPVEFWREVVDRVQAEVPDTLLLAEAFWLMEGYFVRTLGMHRVYNSAFMNMLKMEENLKYRMTVKNVLEFSPEVLKRFVNFMNNPDEMTAVEQFGKGDKYIGVSVLMVTMPGLPMFGHGQVEGFTEKYGMEFRRANWDERPDEDLVHRHEREVFPLIRRRWQFSEVENFAFFDFVHPDGYVNENVFAYANNVNGHRSLMLYNNAFPRATGAVHTSTAINTGSADEKRFIHRTLSEVLGLRNGEDMFYIFRDHRAGLQFIRSTHELASKGLHAVLDGYNYQAFLDWEEVGDSSHIWARVAARLNGAGVPDIHRVYREVRIGPLLNAFRDVVNAESLREIIASIEDAEVEPGRAARRVIKALTAFLDTLEDELGVAIESEGVIEAVCIELATLRGLSRKIDALAPPRHLLEEMIAPLPVTPDAGSLFWAIPVLWTLSHRMDEVLPASSMEGASAGWMEDWLLTAPMCEALEELGATPAEAHRVTHLLMALVQHVPVILSALDCEAGLVLGEMLDDPVAASFLRANNFGGVLWVGKEPMDEVTRWLAFLAAIPVLADEDLTHAQKADIVTTRLDIAKRVIAAVAASGCDVEKTIRLLESGAPLPLEEEPAAEEFLVKQ